MTSESKLKVPQNVLASPVGPWTEKDFPFSYIVKSELKELHNTVFKHGYITKFGHKPNDCPQDTALTIEDEGGHEYNFMGQEAHEALTHAHRGVRKHQHVYFFANETTKTVAAIVMEYLGR